MSQTQPQCSYASDPLRVLTMQGLRLAYQVLGLVDRLDNAGKRGERGRHSGGHRQGVSDAREADHEPSSVPIDPLTSAVDAERAYLAKIHSIPRLQISEEIALATRMRSGDADARNRLVAANLGLVVMFARRYARPGLPLIDLIAEGNMGLLACTRFYDPDRGFRFATYAKLAITQAIVRAIPRLTGAISVGYAEADSVRQVELSMDILETVPASDDGEPFDGINALMRGQILSTAMQTLSEREREIVTARFGLAGGELVTLATLSRQFGVSIERVRQIEATVLRKLAACLESGGQSSSTML